RPSVAVGRGGAVDPSPVNPGDGLLPPGPRARAGRGPGAASGPRRRPQRLDLRLGSEVLVPGAGQLRLGAVALVGAGARPPGARAGALPAREPVPLPDRHRRLAV